MLCAFDIIWQDNNGWDKNRKRKVAMFHNKIVARCHVNNIFKRSQ